VQNDGDNIDREQAAQAGRGRVANQAKHTVNNKAQAERPCNVQHGGTIDALVAPRFRTLLDLFGIPAVTGADNVWQWLNIRRSPVSR
jgi:glyoxylate carboligase